jgi:thiol:disulfide interchange protein
VLLPVPLEVSTLFKPDVLKSDLEIKLKAVWLVCKQECIPEEGEFALKIPVQGSTALHKAAFDAAAALYPQALSSPASAKIAGQQLQFRIEQLPEALRGKKLELFPEAAEVLENGARLDASSGVNADANSGANSGAKWTQAWQGQVWTASFPISAQRSASPAEMPLVLTADGQPAYRVLATVQSSWPSLAPKAQMSPELTAALAANANASKAPIHVDGDVTSLLPALLFALIGGLILNLMPCVFPVLAIKVLSFSQASSTLQGQRARVTSGMAYTAGVILSFIALGGLMLALRAGGQALGWGFQLQSPAVIAALAVLFTLIALNLLGVFELASILPSSVATLQAKNPQIDAFLTGVLAVAVASPCTAPFMGASLGFALGLPAWQALAVFAVLGLGMALPYLIASIAPGFAARMPKPSQRWLGCCGCMGSKQALMARPHCWLLCCCWRCWSGRSVCKGVHAG